MRDKTIEFPRNQHFSPRNTNSRTMLGLSYISYVATLEFDLYSRYSVQKNFDYIYRIA